jgi:phosphatidylglycerophosphatase A
VIENHREAPVRPIWPIWIATCGKVGYFPVAPGTVGSAVGVGLVMALAQLPVTRFERIGLVAAAVAGLGALGVWAAGRAEKFYGRADPSQVVIDEVVGQMIALALRPDARWPWLLAGFLIFRILDVLKPPPVRQLERLPGGWGIMLDDVAAGLYGLAVLALLRWIW